MNTGLHASADKYSQIWGVDAQKRGVWVGGRSVLNFGGTSRRFHGGQSTFPPAGEHCARRNRQSDKAKDRMVSLTLGT